MSSMTGLDSLLEVCYPQGNQATHHLDRFSVYGPVHMISMHFNSIPPNSQESVFSVFLGSVSPLEELRFSPGRRIRFVMQTALVTLGDARCGGNSTSDGFRGLQCFSPRTTGPLKLVERKECHVALQMHGFSHNHLVSPTQLLCFQHFSF